MPGSVWYSIIVTFLSIARRDEWFVVMWFPNGYILKDFTCVWATLANIHPVPHPLPTLEHLGLRITLVRQRFVQLALLPSLPALAKPYPEPLLTMSFPQLAGGGGADCGPANPMANLMKQFHQDRSLQQASHTLSSFLPSKSVELENRKTDIPFRIGSWMPKEERAPRCAFNKRKPNSDTFPKISIIERISVQFKYSHASRSTGK